MKPWGSIDMVQAGYSEDFELESRKQGHHIIIEETVPVEVGQRIEEMARELQEYVRVMESTEKGAK